MLRINAEARHTIIVFAGPFLRWRVDTDIATSVPKFEERVDLITDQFSSIAALRKRYGQPYDFVLSMVPESTVEFALRYVRDSTIKAP